MFGDPAVTGKSADDDLREGKQTLLIALAEEAGRRRRPAAARDVLGDPDAGAEEFDAAAPAARDHRRPRPRRGADRRADRAWPARPSPTAPIADDARAALDALAVAATSRTA